MLVFFTLFQDIRQDDFIEVEVGEIPEEGDNEESLLRDEEKEDVDNTEGVEDEYRSELGMAFEVKFIRFSTRFCENSSKNTITFNLIQ